MKTSDWNPSAYQENSSPQEALGSALHAKLELRGDETILDLGCGDGRLSAVLAQRVPRGRVTGMDASAAMVEHATRTHGGSPSLVFVRGDARDFSLPNPVDVVVSSAALHWVPDLEPAFLCCRRALKTRGRFLVQMGGQGNIREILEVAREVMGSARWCGWYSSFEWPWTMHGPDHARSAAATAGLRVLRAELLERELRGRDPEKLLGWICTTWFPLATRLPEHLRMEMFAEIRDKYLGYNPPDSDGFWHLGMVRLEVEAVAA